MFKFILLFLLLVPNVYAQEEVKAVQLTDDSGLGILDESGNKIVSEYVEVCRDVKGHFTKCPKEGENAGFIKQTIERRCRQDGKFVKCPK